MQFKKTSQASVLFLALGFSLLLSGCDKDDPQPSTTNSITDIVVKGANFTLLEAAVVKANLQATLAGATKYTVFAPTDSGFAASGITSSALNALTSAQASSLILYHAIPGTILAADVPAGPNAKVTTASGDSVFVTRNASGVFVNGVKVTTANVAADNGVVHVIGKVLSPPVGNIVETAVAARLDSLVKAVTRATSAPGGDPSLAGTLGSATLTVFAPTNAAFTQLLTNLSLTDINQIPIATLLAVLRYHVKGGRAFSSDLADGSLAMLAGGNTTIGLTNGTSGGPTITGTGNGANRSNITATNIVCRNGVVHLIDRVLVP